MIWLISCLISKEQASVVNLIPKDSLATSLIWRAVSLLNLPLECFDNKLVSWFFKDMGCIPVDRKVKNELDKKEEIKLLNEGLVLGIFPEGTRNRTSELLLPFKYGAVSLAAKTGAYIVPAGITGKYKFRGKIKVKYGKPFKVSNDLESANVKLKEEITKLIKE